MKSSTTGAVSGCIVWALVFGALLSCFIPVAMMVGGFSSVTDFAVKTVGPMVCPNDTTPHINTYETTTTDEFGNESPATGFEMQCLDANRKVVKTDPVMFSFIWIGILMLVGLVAAAGLAFLLAAPVGLMIAKLFQRGKQARGKSEDS